MKVNQKNILLRYQSITARIITFKARDRLSNPERYFKLRCYPNGNCKKNHGYISLKVEESLSKVFYEPCSLHVTFALIDNERNLRFPQSFVLDYKEKSNHSRFIGFSRYIKRSILVDSEFFDTDYLLVQCEVKYCRRNNISDDWVDPLIWSTHEILKKSEEILSDNSPYFRRSINEGTEVYAEGQNPSDVLNLIQSILINTDQALENINSAFDLYSFADYTLMSDVKQNCSDYLKKNMKPEMVFPLICFADMHSDDDLKKFVCKYVAQHWNNKIVLKNFNILRLKRLDLAQEILDFRKSEELTPRKLATNGSKEVLSKEMTPSDLYIPETEVSSEETSQTGNKNVGLSFEFYQ
ncbi:uncharacterized protein [Parasteatoda tepidariorum]|uniref:uncharacterized protein n=1 Tax=Parasteatoda tepidariorum TaxID=114398 RepID=UPI0039BC958E